MAETNASTGNSICLLKRLATYLKRQFGLPAPTSTWVKDLNLKYFTRKRLLSILKSISEFHPRHLFWSTKNELLDDTLASIIVLLTVLGRVM